jgi:general secretion pathway protein K
MPSTVCKTNNQTGAVLLAVLVVALVLVILLGVVSQALNNRINLAQQAKQNLQDAAMVYSKLNELSYLLATQRATVAGVSAGRNPQGLLRDDEGHWSLSVIGDEIRTDGFSYTQQNGLHYSIQNEAGLLGINSSGQYWLKKVLATYGLSVVEQANFADILADYADSDDWRRPSGAESYAYEKAQRPMPRNYLLQSCSELWRLQKWSEWLTTHRDWLKFCGISRSERLNLNAIPLVFWQKLWPTSANKITEYRQQGEWLASDGDILLLEPSFALIPEDYYSTLGGNDFRLSVNKGGSKLYLKIAIGNGKSKPILVW